MIKSICNKLLSLFISLTFLTCSAQDSYRDSQLKPEKVMDAIGLKKGMVVGEAGAGRGYFTFKMSKRVGKNGKIYANDINANVLQSIKNRCKRENINNIKTILGKVDDPLFPEGKLDIIIMVYAFHEFDKPVDWLQNVIPYMKPDASLVIIEPDVNGSGYESRHFMSEEKIADVMKEAEYELVRIETFLEDDNVYIYKPKN